MRRLNGRTRPLSQNDPELRLILLEPLFDNIHDDPRWLLFLRKVGRAPEQLAGIKLDIRLADEGA